MTTALVLCPSCGAENAGTRFCESCGAPAPALAPVQPDAVGVPALAVPAGAAKIDRGALHEMALRALAIGPVALVFFPALTGSILVLLGGLEGFYYEYYGATGTSLYGFLSGLWLAWPLTLILAVLTAAAGTVAALTTDRPAPVKATAIGLAVAGTAFLAFWTWGWVPGGVAFAAAWILLTRLRGWSYFALFVPLVTGILSIFALMSADVHILLAAFLIGLLAAATAAGVLFAGRYLSAMHARQPPKPPPPPSQVAAPQPGYAPGPMTTGQVMPGQVVAGPMITGQVVPVGAVVVPGYPQGFAPGYQMPQRTNGFAVAALILGLLTGTVLAVVFGHIALSQIKRTGERGRGMAIVGLVLGYVWTSVWLAYLIFLIVVAVTAANSFNSYSY